MCLAQLAEAGCTERVPVPGPSDHPTNILLTLCEFVLRLPPEGLNPKPKRHVLGSAGCTERVPGPESINLRQPKLLRLT